MKKFLLALVLMLSLSSMVAGDVYARRFGGMSFGRQSMNIGRPAPMGRSMSQTKATQQTQQRANTAKAAGTQTAGSRWGGFLGGALLGLGLGALLGHFGIGGDMAGIISTILMLVIIFYVVRFIFRRFFRRNQEQTRPVYARGRDDYDQDRGFNTPEIGSGISQGSASETRPTWSIPADFDTSGFLREAKGYFFRLQAAWDKGDLNDIHGFTSPEMFAEIRLQLIERGNEPNITIVEDLQADLLGIETFNHEYMASVKFSGRIKDGVSGHSEYFEEVWNMTKPIDESKGWVLAGVQEIA